MRTIAFALRDHHQRRAVRWTLLAALAALATACSTTPAMRGQQSTALIRAGDAARDQGDLTGAAANYAKAATADPHSLEAQLRLGAADLARKDEDGAFAAFEAAQNLAPKDPEAAFRLGEIELTRGAAGAAAAQFTTALQARKTDAKLYNAMGVALAMQGQFDLAKENYDQGLDLAPDYPALRNNYGLLQLATGNLPGALQTFSSLVASPHATDRYRFNRALVELAMGRTETALADAPGTDEAGLRRALTAYLSRPSADPGADQPPPPWAHADADAAAPIVHLDVATEQPRAVAAAQANTAATKAVAPPANPQPAGVNAPKSAKWQ